MKNVLMVFGGMSYEHEISIVTASQIYNKTMIDDVKIIPLYLTVDNAFYVYNSKKFDIADFSKNKLDLTSKKFKEVRFVSGEKRKLFEKTRFGLKEYIQIENIIFACHGGVGENGELVSYFKNLGFKVGAGSFDALAICMNKFLFKQVMKGLKIPVVSGFKITKIDFENGFESCLTKIKFLKFPVVIKSNSGGSSIGLFVVNTRKEFSKTIKDAFEFDEEVLIEEYKENTREFNVAVIGSGKSYIVSEIDEPIKENDILTFADKYLSQDGKGFKKNPCKGAMSSSLRNFPAKIDNDLKLKIQGIARKIFCNLNLSGVVRIDFLYQAEKGKLYVCEVNAIPGSLAYYFFDENLVSCNDLVKKLIDVSEINYQKNLVIKPEYFTNILE